MAMMVDVAGALVASLLIVVAVVIAADAGAVFGAAFIGLAGLYVLATLFIGRRRR